MSSKQDIQRYQVEDSSEDDEGKVSPSRLSTFKKRLFKKDKRRFNKYIRSTTTHGVVYIFIGKSKIRRIFWLLIVLSAAIGCLYNISNRVAFLASGPTSTTISIVESESVDFPAVTLCNLNLVKKSYLEKISNDLGPLLREAFYTQELLLDCNDALKYYEMNSKLPFNQSFSDLIWLGRHTAEEMIYTCKFMGRDCNTSDFLPTLTPSGVCYTFNTGRVAPVLKTNGTGARHALTIQVDISQYEYSVAHSHDAGIKIAVHPQNEPPQPDELGIAVPPGKNGFISVRQTNIENRSSRRKCRDTSDTTSLNFPQGEYPYSVSACQTDCLKTNVAQSCKCLGAGMRGRIPPTSRFHKLQNCTIKDICCQVSELNQASPCKCQEACKKTLYTTGASYSEFPANYAAQDLINIVSSVYNNISNNNIGLNISIFKENYLGVNIYFETLTVEERVTNDAYDFIALLSDIGGQLGLFLGASVISVFEFLTWLFDETKDRCCGISERKITNKLKSLTGVGKTEQIQKQHEKQANNNNLSVDSGGDGMDDYREFEAL